MQQSTNFSNNVCISGGAIGADIAWGEIAQNNGHQVIHWSFDTHKPKIKENIYILTDDQLKVADPFLKQANKSLKRSFPTRSKHVDDLLRRDYWQVVDSDALYIVSWFIRDNSLLKINGGSAWAAQIYLDVCIANNKIPNLYMFEQNEELWYCWENKWVQKIPPTPTGIYAGIGTRDLNLAGLEAIQNIYI